MPAITGYAKVGAPASAQLAIKFADATAAGFCAGRRNRVTVVDIDSTDGRLVDDCLARFGPTPLQVVTPSGGRHLYYRNGGEARRIRPLPDVDILGAGNVVAAGSVVPKGRYQIERGTLDDLDRLPPLRAAPAPAAKAEKVREGERNVELFRHCKRQALYCDTPDALLDVARTWAANRMSAPLPDAEVAKTAASAWRYRGERRLFMQHVIESPVYHSLIAKPEVWAVAAHLMTENGPSATFMITDTLGDKHGWPRRLVPTARKTLLYMGIVACVRQPRKGSPGLYRWRLPEDK